MARAARTKASSRRDQRVDALRGLAVMSMFVAHCCPIPGPFRIFNLAQFLTAPLFALLIGVGAQIADRGTRGLPMAFVRAGIRAGVLVVLSLWLTSWGSEIDVVLMYLALPTLLAPLLTRLPSSILGVLACALWSAEPLLQQRFTPKLVSAELHHDTLGRDLWEVTLAGEHYRLTELLVFTILGIVVWRWVNGTKVRWQPPVLGGLMLAAAAGMLAAKEAGRITFLPYTGAHLELFFDVLLTAGLALVWLGLAPRKVSFGPLSECGAMTLSVYTIQIAYLAWYVNDYAPGARDHSWGNFVVLIAMGLLFPILWRSLVTRQPWQRGPIEGPVALVTGIFR